MEWFRACEWHAALTLPARSLPSGAYAIALEARAAPGAPAPPEPGWAGDAVTFFVRRPGDSDEEVKTNTCSWDAPASGPSALNKHSVDKRMLLTSPAPRESHGAVRTGAGCGARGGAR